MYCLFGMVLQGASRRCSDGSPFLRESGNGKVVELEVVDAPLPANLPEAFMSVMDVPLPTYDGKGIRRNIDVRLPVKPCQKGST